jgi:TonB family protein
MSVNPNQVMSEDWTKWQGHVINGMFPLGRYLGCSNHSGVFLTVSAARHPSEVAIKLVPTNRTLAELLLPRWNRAGGLVHPHVLRLWQWGGCQLDGLPYLYAVMEYADQTLAQVLSHRALAEGEVREMMLPPTLEALAFLHGQGLVQGQLKPANILVVGDQLTLASDTIRPVRDGTICAGTPTVYDPPESRNGSRSTAGDIWALGVSLVEALTRRRPSGLGGPGEGIVLPAEFPPAFRDIVTRCLSYRPQERPSATDLIAWAGGRSAASPPTAIIESAAVVPADARTPDPAPARTEPPPVAPNPARPERPMAQSAKTRALLAMTLGAVTILALSWTGVRMLGMHRTPAPLPIQTPGGSLPQTPGDAAPAAAGLRAHASAASMPKPDGSDVASSTATQHEVIPEVPWSARQTIRGHIRVWVRVIVDQGGAVLAAAADRAGPSEYFERLAIEAARKWTFPPIEAPSRRVIQVRFDFSRDGTTGHAVAFR